MPIGGLVKGAIGALGGAGSSAAGGQQVSNDFIQTRTPSPLVEGQVGQIIDGATSLFNQFSDGGLAAPFSDDQNSAFNIIRGQATNPSVVPQAQSALAGFIGADPTQVSRDFENNILSRVTPRINENFTGAGRRGSGSHGDSIARGVSEAIAPILFQSQEAARNRSLNAIRSAPGLEAAGFIGANNLLNSGQIQQGQTQREIDAPFEALNRFNSVINPIAQAFATTERESTQQSGGGRSGILGGAARGFASSFI